MSHHLNPYIKAPSPSALWNRFTKKNNRQKPVLATVHSFAALFSISLFCTSVSAETSFPHGCEVTGFGFSQSELVLNEKGGQAFYMIQNRSAKKIELEHFETRKDIFMSPKLETKLDPLSWAAFASDIQNSHFRCYTQENGDKMLVSCREALDVCQYPRVKFALSNMGDYWISTNKPREQVIKDAVTKGILLRW